MNYRQPGFSAPPLSKTNKFLLIIMASCFLLNAILSQFAGLSLIPILGVSPAGVESGMIWQFVTYSLLPQGLFGLLFNCMLIWFLGGELETIWGQKFYLKYIGVGVISAAVFYLLLSYFVLASPAVAPLFGPTGICFVLLLAYALIYPDREFLLMFVFPVKAKYFCLILAGIQIYMSIFSSSALSSGSYLLSVVVAFLYLRGASYLARASQFSARKKRQQAKKKFKVIINDEFEEFPPKDPSEWH